MPLARLLAALLAPALAAPAAPSRARADDRKVACARDAEEGQRQRGRGRLQDALASFTRCAAPACPAVIVADCAAWRAEVDAALPSLVLRATAAEDERTEVGEVEVHLDGAIVARRLDGRPLVLDPGEHELVLVASGRAPLRTRLVARAGEKNRLVSLPLERVEPPRRIGRGAGVLLGVGGVALGAFGYLGLSGWAEVRALDRRCAPACPPTEVDAARARLRAADVSLAVGLAALAGAGLLAWRW